MESGNKGLKREKVKFVVAWEKPEYSREVIDLWNRLKALPPGINPHERAKQVVYLAYVDNLLIGITTAQRINYQRLLNAPLFSFRILIHPKFRIPGLLDKMSVETIKFLENLYQTHKTDCIGVLTLVENKRMRTHRREAVFPSTKFAFIGQTKEGFDVRIRYFQGASLPSE